MIRWSKCVHLRVIMICLLTVVATVVSLGFTLATKGLVDGAVSSNMSGIKKFGLILVAIILTQHVLSAARRTA